MYTAYIDMCVYVCVCVCVCVGGGGRGNIRARNIARWGTVLTCVLCTVVVCRRRKRAGGDITHLRGDVLPRGRWNSVGGESAERLARRRCGAVGLMGVCRAAGGDTRARADVRCWLWRRMSWFCHFGEEHDLVGHEGHVDMRW